MDRDRDHPLRCPVCRSVYVFDYALRLHLATAHKYNATALLSHMCTVKAVAVCSECVLPFKSFSAYKLHLSAVHKQIPDTKPTVFCPLCPFETWSLPELHLHVAFSHKSDPMVHGSFNEKKLYFANKKSFMQWKDNLEMSTGSTFSINNSTRRFIVYVCHRSAAKKEVGKATVRNTTSKKMDILCTAHIKVSLDPSGILDVSACLGHVGHVMNPLLQRFNRTMRREIWNVVEKTNSRAEALVEIQQKFRKSKSRLAHIASHDLRNLEKYRSADAREDEEEEKEESKHVSIDYDPLATPPFPSAVEDMPGPSTPSIDPLCALLEHDYAKTESTGMAPSSSPPLLNSEQKQTFLICPKCGVEMEAWYMSKHLWDKHFCTKKEVDEIMKELSPGEIDEDTDDTVLDTPPSAKHKDPLLVCPVCDRETRFMSKHLWDEHDYTKEEVDEIMIEIFKKTEHKTFSCLHCDEVFPTHASFVHHSTVHHGIKIEDRHFAVPGGDPRRNNVINCLLPSCPFISTYSVGEMAQHVMHNHANQIRGEVIGFNRTFKDSQEFEAYREQLHAQTGTSFIIISRRQLDACKLNGVTAVMRMRCKRSGLPPNFRLKWRGRTRGQKLVERCLAFANAFVYSNGSIRFVGCTGHVGHLPDYPNKEEGETREQMDGEGSETVVKPKSVNSTTGMEMECKLCSKVVIDMLGHLQRIHEMKRGQIDRVLRLWREERDQRKLEKSERERIAQYENALETNPDAPCTVVLDVDEPSSSDNDYRSINASLQTPPANTVTVVVGNCAPITVNMRAVGKDKKDTVSRITKESVSLAGVTFTRKRRLGESRKKDEMGIPKESQEMNQIKEEFDEIINVEDLLPVKEEDYDYCTNWPPRRAF